jgi:hypothetical protein
MVGNACSVLLLEVHTNMSERITSSFKFGALEKPFCFLVSHFFLFHRSYWPGSGCILTPPHTTLIDRLPWNHRVQPSHVKKSALGQLDVTINEATNWQSRQELGKIQSTVKHST